MFKTLNKSFLLFFSCCGSCWHLLDALRNSPNAASAKLSSHICYKRVPSIGLYE